MSITSSEIYSLDWHKSRRSAGNGACVEVVVPADGKVFIRDSQDQRGPVVQYPERSWRVFVGDAKKGQFDLDVL